MALSGSLNFLSASEIGTFEFTAAPGIRVYSTVTLLVLPADTNHIC